MTPILFVGDVVAAPGRRTLRALLPGLREQHGIDFVVVNGENAAGGVGITPKTADDLFAMGADVITLGNHTYRHRDVYRYLDEHPNIVRPANFLPSQPGRGTCVVDAGGTGPCGYGAGVAGGGGGGVCAAETPAVAKTIPTASSDFIRYSGADTRRNVRSEASAKCPAAR